MLKIIVWGPAYSPEKIKYILKIIGDAEIIGVTSNDNIVGCLDGIKFYSINCLKEIKFDLLLLATNPKYFHEIRSLAKRIGIPNEKILSTDLFFFPGFRWEKYCALRKARLSIISQGCWGGIISSFLQIPFLTPTINIAFEEDHFLRMISNLEFYMNCDLEFCRLGYNQKEEKITPVYTLNQEVEVPMVHDENFLEAQKKWYERRKRINFDNLLFVMITENPDTLDQFEKLPFEKKVCFVPFHSEAKSAFYIPNNLQHRTFWEIVHSLAFNNFYPYDIWELLLYGHKKKRLC